MATSDLIKSAVSAASSGKTVDSNNVDSLNTGGTSTAQEQYDTTAHSSESTVDDLSPVSEDAPTDSSETELAAATAKPQTATPKTSGEKEVITITDETGRKRKIEIDYSDKSAIKKAFEMQGGARKWQADRDRAIQNAKKAQEELDKVKNDFSILDQAFQRGGAEEVFDLLQGRKGAFAEHVKKQQERQRFLENASPEEIEALKVRELAEQQAKQNERLRKENEEFKKQMMTERETAELRSLEAKVHPVFNKYRFAERLGNGDDEHMFDEMLWNTALKRLEPYEEQGLDITPELVEREFSSVAKSIRNRINVQSEKKATRVVAQKKQEATENVQAKAMSGYRTNNAKVNELLAKGDTSGLIKSWGNLFGKK